MNQPEGEDFWPGRLSETGSLFPPIVQMVGPLEVFELAAGPISVRIAPPLKPR